MDKEFTMQFSDQTEFYPDTEIIGGKLFWLVFLCMLCLQINDNNSAGGKMANGGGKM